MFIILSDNIYLRLNQLSIQYSTDNISYTPITDWPPTFFNYTGIVKTIYITNNLEMTNSSMYFIMGSGNITIDGQTYGVNINSVANYKGLVQNGNNANNGFNNIIITNLGVTTTNGSTLYSGGWICQEYMNKAATGCQINNCYSTGDVVGVFAGGILGAVSSGVATNCYSTGAIVGLYAGGIFGPYSNGTATNCYSTGDMIGVYAGGIFGVGDPMSLIYGSATNCYSTGAILGQFAGGIFAPNTMGPATNCYSTGAIIGSSAGGIYGVASTYSFATNCYSAGSIIGGQYAGGIFGLYPGYQTGTFTHCYVANGNWNDQTAITYLTGAPTYLSTTLTQQGNIWIDIDLFFSSPFRLKSFNKPVLYNPNSVSTIIRTGSTTVNSAIGIIGYGIYQIVDVFVNNVINYQNLFTIQPITGSISYTNLNVNNIYQIRVLFNYFSQQNRYIIDTFTIQVLSPPFTNFSLSPLSMDEGTLYSGSFTSDSPTAPQYVILSQPIDNNLYISGNSIIAKYPLYYREYRSYPVQISGTASGLTIMRSFNIQIVNLPDAPIEVYISNNQIPGNSAIGTSIGTLKTYDYDPNDAFTYQFVSGLGSEDNSRFTIEGDVLYIATTLNYNTQDDTFSIRVKTTDSSKLSIENPIILYVIRPIAGSFETSGLIGSPSTIQLQGYPISGSGGSLIYQITRQPQYGSLIPVSNSVYTYVPVPTSNYQDSFQYVVKEDTMTSLPGTVIITNYSESDIDIIPMNMGNMQFDNISFDGDVWKFGTLTTNTFIHTPGSAYFRVGNFILKN